MHLADAFIQSDLHCIQVTVSALAFPGNRTHDLGVVSAMLYQLSYRKAINLFIELLPLNEYKSAKDYAIQTGYNRCLSLSLCLCVS